MISEGILSSRRLADLLCTPAEWLQEIADHTESLYRPFTDYTGGKPRVIDQPVDPLKRLQSRIYRLLLRDYSYSPFAYGGVPKKTIFDALRPHVAQPVLLVIDVRKFYPSVSYRLVFQMWRELLGHSDDVSRVLTRLTTYQGGLPQGASTSMAIANIVMESADQQIAAALVNRYGLRVRYSRWVDDLIVSGAIEPAFVLSVVAGALRPLGLSPHRTRTKRRIMSCGDRQWALGLNINRRQTIPRDVRANLRAAVHQAAMGVDVDIDSLMGRLEFLHACHEEESKKLLRRLLRVSERAKTTLLRIS